MLYDYNAASSRHGCLEHNLLSKILVVVLGIMYIYPREIYCLIGGIYICVEVSSDPIFLWCSSNSFPLNLQFVRSYQAEIIILKRLIGECNYATRMRVEPRSCNQGRRKKDVFTFSVTLPTLAMCSCLKAKAI